MNPVGETKTSSRALWFLFVAFSAVLGTMKGFARVGGADIWWHLKTGELAWTTRSLLPTDPFSFSYFGKPWHYKDLLADVALYLGFSRLSYVFFALLQMMVVVIMAGSVYFATRKAHRSPFACTIVAGATVIAIHGGIIPRPLIFSLMAYPPMVVLLVHLWRTPETDLSRWWRDALLTGLLCLITSVWMFFHRAALLGYGLLVLWVTSSILAYAFARWRWPWSETLFGPVVSGKQLLMRMGALVGAFLFGGLGPFGFKPFIMGVSVATSPVLNRYITEWAPIGIGDLFLEFPVFCGLTVLVLSTKAHAIAVAIKQGARPVVPCSLTLVYLGLLVLTFKSVRWLPYCAVFGALISAEEVGCNVLAVGRRLTLPLRTRGLALCLVCVASVALFHQQNRFEYGLGEKPGWYPSGAVAFAKEHGISGPVVNAFHTAGYLIYHMWPDVKVLVDGRNDTVYPPAFVVRAIEAQTSRQAFEALAPTRAASWVLASNVVGYETHLFLRGDPDWMMVYWSEPVVVYVRRSAYPRLRGFEYRLIQPNDPVSSVAGIMSNASSPPQQRAQIEREVNRMVRSSPEGLRSNCALAVYYHFEGPTFYPERDRIVRDLEIRYGRVPGLMAVKERFQAESFR